MAPNGALVFAPFNSQHNVQFKPHYVCRSGSCLPLADAAPQTSTVLVSTASTRFEFELKSPPNGDVILDRSTDPAATALSATAPANATSCRLTLTSRDRRQASDPYDVYYVVLQPMAKPFGEGVSHLHGGAACAVRFSCGHSLCCDACADALVRRSAPCPSCCASLAIVARGAQIGLEQTFVGTV